MVISYLVAVIVGLLVGSFLNVCIYRIPLPDRSILRPNRSYCPECSQRIAWYDNVPVLSYLLLCGRCRHCRSRISLEYPIVELIAGLAALWTVWRFGVTTTGVALFLYVCILLTLSMIDLHHYLIPDKIVVFGLAVAILIALLEIFRGQRQPISLLTGLIGLLIGGGSLLLIALLGERIFRKEAMGGGDIKLMAMMGLYLAWWPQSHASLSSGTFFVARQLMLIIVVGSFLGAIGGFGVILARAKGSEERIVPFGPFLALSSLLVMAFGNPIWHWYMDLLG